MAGRSRTACELTRAAGIQVAESASGYCGTSHAFI
jgi:hypothetical protein